MTNQQHNHIAPIEIVTLTADRLSATAQIESRCFSEPWSENALAYLLGSNTVAFAALCGGELIGYGGMVIALDEGQITNIAVHPTHRRLGAGRAILSALSKEAKKRGLKQISLEVRPSNTAAVSLYEQHGFSIAGRRKNFYKKPCEDALVMLCSLSEKV